MANPVFYVTYDDRDNLDIVDLDLNLLDTIHLPLINNGKTVLDDVNKRLYVLSYFNNCIFVVDVLTNMYLETITGDFVTASNSSALPIENPTDGIIANGFLYIATDTKQTVWQINISDYTDIVRFPLGFRASAIQYITSKGQFAVSNATTFVNIYNSAFTFVQALGGTPDYDGIFYSNVKDKLYLSQGNDVRLFEHNPQTAYSVTGAYSFPRPYNSNDVILSQYDDADYIYTLIIYGNNTETQAIKVLKESGVILTGTVLTGFGTANNVKLNTKGIFYGVQNSTYYYFGANANGLVYKISAVDDSVTYLYCNIDTVSNLVHGSFVWMTYFEPPIPPIPPPPPIYGCTDPIARNFNPLATIDDGTCAYDPLAKLKCCAGDLAYKIAEDAALGKKACEGKMCDLTYMINALYALDRYIANGDVLSDASAAYFDLKIVTGCGSGSITLQFNDANDVQLEFDTVTLTTSDVNATALNIAETINSQFGSSGFYASYGVGGADSLRVFAPLSVGAVGNTYKIVIDVTGASCGFTYLINGRAQDQSFAFVFIGGKDEVIKTNSCLTQVQYNNMFQNVTEICSKYGCNCGQGTNFKDDTINQIFTPMGGNPPVPITPTPFLLLEDRGYILLEDGGKIILEP